MAVTVAQTVDVAQALATILGAVDGVRVHWYVADTARPPVAVIGQPDIDYTDTTTGFCRAAWRFPVRVVVARNNDREAQAELSRLVSEIANALDDADVTNTPLWSVEPQDARPSPVTVNGQELPGYLLTVLVRA